jgi:hypothetical protein
MNNDERFKDVPEPLRTQYLAGSTRLSSDAELKERRINPLTPDEAVEVMRSRAGGTFTTEYYDMKVMSEWPQPVRDLWLGQQIVNVKAMTDAGWNVSSISDGYHTFQQLYDMRLALTVAAFKGYSWSVWPDGPIPALHEARQMVWRSKLHADGTMFDDYFIVGLDRVIGDRLKIGYITFHYHIDHWNKFDFCKVLDKAPEWDGHTDKDVIERLLSL